MNHVIENGVLKVFLSGHIDSSNAPATESEIFAIRDEQPHEAMILDLRELSYISSAGLRIVLRLRKAEPELKLTNVSPEVYEIFSMTGFTEMMPVEKAYRNISIEGCEAIGRGANRHGVSHRQGHRGQGLQQRTVLRMCSANANWPGRPSCWAFPRPFPTTWCAWASNLARFLSCSIPNPFPN